MNAHHGLAAHEVVLSWEPTRTPACRARRTPSDSSVTDRMRCPRLLVRILRQFHAH